MPSKKDVPKVCEQCGMVFLVRRSDARRGLGRFCSRSCKSRSCAPEVLLIGAVGENNPNWRGGHTKFTNGYWYVLRPNHERALKSGYVKRADLVLEAKLGRPLEPGEIAHHKDENRENDSPSNLEPMRVGPHNRHHHGKAVHTVRKSRSRNPDHPSNQRYEWPSDVELLALRDQMSLRQIARAIGCNHKAVDRRIKRIKK